MAENGRKGKAGMMFVCGTPAKCCTGKTNPKDGNSFHGTQDQVRACVVNYYVNTLGYTKISPRELQAPNGGPILVLSKRPVRAKPGKADNTWMGRDQNGALVGRRVRTV